MGGIHTLNLTFTQASLPTARLAAYAALGLIKGSYQILTGFLQRFTQR